MKRTLALVYVLVLATQLPHVGAVYANLEQPGWYVYTAWGAAVAFELSVAVFTFRIVVDRSTRRATRAGLGFFLVASCVANATYYGLAPAMFRWIMPVFATIALPLSLALFAGEFGAEVRRDERRAARLERLEQAQNVTETVTERDQRKMEPVPALPATRETFLASHPDVLEMSGKQIAEMAGVSTRTGNNWKRAARNGNGTEVPK